MELSRRIHVWFANSSLRIIDLTQPIIACATPRLSVGALAAMTEFIPLMYRVKSTLLYSLYTHTKPFTNSLHCCFCNPQLHQPNITRVFDRMKPFMIRFDHDYFILYVARPDSHTRPVSRILPHVVHMFNLLTKLTNFISLLKGFSLPNFLLCPTWRTLK